jgi:hypothetical protein
MTLFNRLPWRTAQAARNTDPIAEAREARRARAALLTALLGDYLSDNPLMVHFLDAAGYTTAAFAVPPQCWEINTEGCVKLRSPIEFTALYTMVIDHYELRCGEQTIAKGRMTTRAMVDPGNSVKMTGIDVRIA